jgi:hypothetical protein
MVETGIDESLFAGAVGFKAHPAEISVKETIKILMTRTFLEI